jgi:two-component system, OmpR family, sensor histidine kinase PrrB
MRAPRSLRARITLAALAAVAIGGAVAGALLLAAVERDGRRAVDRDLRERAAGFARGGPGRGFEERLRGRPGPPGGEELLAGSGSFVQVAVGDRVLERRGDVPDEPPAVPEADGFRTVEIDGAPWRSLTFSPGGPADVRLELLSTLDPVEDRVASIRELVIVLGLGALALTGLAAWAFTSLAVRPLGRLQSGAARVSGAEDLQTPLPDEGPDEVRSLAGALNAMLARLQASSAAQQRALEATRRFAADAGHELRTPLTGLRANLDALERNPDLPAEQRAALVRETLAEQERMVHLLEGLQALARGEAAESLPREDVELADLVDAAVYAARRRHPAVEFELDDRIGDATLRGWGNGLRLLVENLLDNAALHGRPGGNVRVALERDGGALVVRVEDDGRGIAADDRERVLEPFARGNGATAPGTGLGLAIVAQQVALHGGDLRLGESSLGGLAVEGRFPEGVSASGGVGRR